MHWPLRSDLVRTYIVGGTLSLATTDFLDAPLSSTGWAYTPKLDLNSFFACIWNDVCLERNIITQHLFGDGW